MLEEARILREIADARFSLPVSFYRTWLWLALVFILLFGAGSYTLVVYPLWPQKSQLTTSEGPAVSARPQHPEPLTQKSWLTTPEGATAILALTWWLVGVLAPGVLAMMTWFAASKAHYMAFESETLTRKLLEYSGYRPNA